MINNSKFQNCSVSFPAIEGLGLTETLGKVRIKNIYQTWNGENINQIRDRHESNPYTLRIGMPAVDERLKNDSIYCILDYLSYNPLTKNVEQRQLVPLRNMEKLYIGQSLQEAEYKDYRLFVDGNAVVDDLYLKKYESIGDQPVGRLLVNLMDTVEKLKLEVVDLKRQLKTQHIYK
jgi:hypothetical protein